MASRDSRPKLKQPVFIKVNELQPGTTGHNLVVKVVSSSVVIQKTRSNLNNVRNVRVAECVVGDETGVIIFTARNDQVDVLKEGVTAILRNAKIDMFKGSMRLAVDMWGRVEITGPADFVVMEDNNLSLVDYELVSVVDGS